MSKRAALTLILLTPQRVCRADFARPGAGPELSEQERTHGPDVAAAVEAACTFGQAPGKVVYVLATDFWIQTLPVPAGRIFGLNEAEIAQALNFEAEVISGIAAQEAAVAIQALPDEGAEKRFFLLQTKLTERDALARLLHARGSKLGGLLHPAGLPRAFGGDEFGPRLELWADAAVGLRPVEGGVDLVVSNADPQTGRWQVDIADWSLRRLLTGPDVRAPAATDAVQLDKLDILTAWFSAWAVELTERRPRTAVVRPLPRPASLRVRGAIAAALVAAAAIGALAHWNNYSHQLADLQAQTKAATEKKKHLDDAEAKTKTQREEKDKAAKEAAHFNRLAQDVKNLQSRYAGLLEVLLSEKPREAMIRRIESDKGEPKLIGLALRPEIVDEYARALTPAARKLGWEVHPPHKTAQSVAADGAPWEFEISFSPVARVLPPAPKGPTPSRIRR